MIYEIKLVTLKKNSIKRFELVTRNVSSCDAQLDFVTRFCNCFTKQMFYQTI